MEDVTKTSGTDKVPLIVRRGPFTVVYQTPQGDWSLAMGGRKWQTFAGAMKAGQKWLDHTSDRNWRPNVRVIELSNSRNARGVPFLEDADAMLAARERTGA